MPRLVQLDELMEDLDLQDVDNKGNRLLFILEAIELLAERRARRRFSPFYTDSNGVEIDGTRMATTYGRPYMPLKDLRVVTSITHHGYTLLDADYDLGYGFPETPATGIEFLWTSGLPASRLFGQVSRLGGIEKNDLVITGKWGFAECPDDVKLAILAWCGAVWRRKQAGYADTVVTQGGAISYSSLCPAESKVVLDSYRPLRPSIVGSRF